MIIDEEIGICPGCRKPFKKFRATHVFCSDTCRYRVNKHRTAKELPNACLFNEGVECLPNKRRCEACGWNPKIAEDRMLKIRQDSGAVK